MARDPFYGHWRQPRRWHVEAMAAVVPALAAGDSPLLHIATGAGKTDATCHLAWLAAARSGEHHGAVIAVPTRSLVEQTYAALVKRAGPGLFSAGRWYGERKEPDADVVVTCYPSAMTLAQEWAITGRRPHLLIVDEAHGSEAPTVRAGLLALEARRLCGLTATAYRSDDTQKLGMFSRVVYEYLYERAVEEGVLVPRRIVPWDPADGVAEMAADDVVLAMLRAEAPTRQGRIWRTVVDADSIADAESYAAKLGQAGVRAAAVHSEMADALVDERVAMLRAHDLDVVVHCNLLSEGVDLPWLRCYALRQRVGARVRLVQRVGRVLRPDPDDASKVAGIVLDPWGLCSTVGLDHEADLGESEQRDAAAEPTNRREWNRLDNAEKAEKVIRAMAQAERWAARLRLELEAAGLCRSPKYPGGAWRRKEATTKQREMLAKMRRFAQYLPSDESRAMLRALADAPDLTRGAATDVIDVLDGLRVGTVEARRAKRYQAVDVECDAPEGAQRVLEWAAVDAGAAVPG